MTAATSTPPKKKRRAKAPPKDTPAHSLHIHTEAARALLAIHRDVLGDDALARADAVEGETHLHEALARALARIAEIDILETGITATMDDLKARLGRLREQREHLRTAAAVAMEIAELDRMETAVGTISLKAVPPRVDVVDESQIPSLYFKAQEPRLDKVALLRALKESVAVPGARLTNGSLSVQITKR